ncbi:MAG: PAS domain-containing protein [Rhodoferax sp.]|nr:PAS domain-containing protein [Rhodoferax sp.]
MKIRNLMFAAMVVSVTVGLAATLAVLNAGQEESRTTAVRSRAQQASHEVSALLVLTQEYARHAEPRAAEQWHARHATILSALGGTKPQVDDDPALVELRDVSASLPELFTTLEKVPKIDTPFNERRKEVLLDQLLTSTQAMSDYAYQWYQNANATRRAANDRFQVLAFATLTVLLLVLLALIFLVNFRVLVPLWQLEQATTAVGQGNAYMGGGSDAQDELGDLSRSFEQMTRKLARSSLQIQESEKRLRLITDNMPGLIAYIDTTQRYQFVNAHFHAFLGDNASVFLGKTVAECVGPSNYAVLQPYLEAALAGERQHYERLNTSDGESQTLLVDYIPDLDAHGTVLGVFALAVDISELKTVQHAYAQGEARLRAITDHIPALVGHFDREERCLFANATVLKAFGKTAQEAHQLTLKSGIDADSYAQHVPYIRRVLAGETCNFEGHVVRNGRDTYFQANLVPDRNPEGDVQGFYLMTFDVSKVRSAEQARKRSEDRLRKIADNLPVLISYIDQDERIQFANRTYETWLGKDYEAMPGKKIQDIISTEQYQLRKGYLQRALQGEHIEFDATTTALGITRELNTSYLPDVDADGKVLGVYTLTLDVTALKAYEAQLKAQARVDTLTGLPNRLQFNEKIAEALERAQRSKQGLALMFLDIDRFKSINDTLGHAMGDAVLKEFSKRLQAHVRQVDLVARLAGDEFVVILEAVRHRDEAIVVARKILQAVAQPQDLKDLQGQPITATTSIGIAYQGSDDADTTPKALLARADEALYAAKGAGRNTVHLA